MTDGGGIRNQSAMKLLIALLFTIPAYASDGAVVCANLLASGGYKVILRQAHDLGVVESATDPVPLEQLYLKLKDAEITKPDAEELRAKLAATRQKQFAIEAMSAPEIRQFYKNSLKALYVRTAGLWYTQEVRTQVGPVMSKELEESLTRYLKQSFSPWGLEDRDLTPQAARDLFKQRKWMSWPWQRIAALMAGWYESRDGDLSFDSKEFGKFWDANARDLSHEIFQKMYLALNHVADSPACCLSEPGCVNCPHNRRWRRKE